MIYLALTLALTLPLTCWLFLRDRAKDRDFWASLLADEAKERAVLLNRIQAPETGITQSLMPQEKFEKPYITEGDEMAQFEQFIEEG